MDDDYSDRSYTYGICILLIFDSLRDLSTRLISVLVFLDPAVAILLDIVFTGFRPTSMQIVGIVLIFVGMAFTFRKRRMKNSSRRKILFLIVNNYVEMNL